jgi:hypothetical protein
MVSTIKIYPLRISKNGRNRYLISSQDETRGLLFDLTFFNGTYKDCYKRALEIREFLINKYRLKDK